MSGIIGNIGSKSSVIGTTVMPAGTIVNTTYYTSDSRGSNLTTSTSANAYVNIMSFPVTAKAANSHYVIHYKVPILFVRSGAVSVWAMVSAYYGTSSNPYTTALYTSTDGSRHEIGMVSSLTTSDFRQIFVSVVKDTAALAVDGVRYYGFRLYNHTTSGYVGVEVPFDPQAVVYEVAT